MSDRRRFELWNYGHDKAVASELMTQEDADKHNESLRAASTGATVTLQWLAVGEAQPGAQPTATGGVVKSYLGERAGDELATLQGLLRVYGCPRCGRPGVARRGPDGDQVISHREAQLPGGFEFLEYCGGPEVALLQKLPPGPPKGS